MNKENNLSNKDYSKFSRAEKLYILSQVCIQNSLTPDNPAYMGLIIRVCTSKLAMSTDTAKQYAADLETAYHADQWQGLAQSHQPDNETEETATSTPRTFEPKTPTLNALNKLTYTSTTPIKKIEPQLSLEPQMAPKTIAAILLKMAYSSDFNGVGRISVSEARYDLDDKTLQAEDIIRLLKQYYPKIDAEQRAGKQVLVYFDGKSNVKTGREIHKIIPPTAPVLPAHREIYEETYAEKETMANKDNIIIGETVEDE